MRKNFSYTLLVVVITGLLSAVATGSAQGAAQEPQGTLIWGQLAVTPSVTPLGNLSINARWVAMSLMDPLFFFRPSEGVFSPGLATSWDLSNPTALRFNLRQGVRFHDGTPFTSADVVTSVNLARTLPGTLAPTFQLIERAEAIDDYTVDIHLAAPSSEVLFALPLLWIVPAWAEADYDAYSRHPIGTGPFRLISFSPEDRVVMEANRDYWMEGAPRIARLEYVAIPEDSSRATALLTGEVQVVDQYPGIEFAAAEANPNVSLALSSAATYRVLWMNAGKEPFSNPLVRQAIRHALDIDAITELVWPDVGLQPRSIVPYGTTCYAEQRPAAYDPALARQLLAQAGYPSGFDLEILKRTNPRTSEEGDVVVAMLQAVGINASYTVLQDSLFVSTALQDVQDWPMVIFAHANVLTDPAFIVRRLYSDKARDLTGWGKTTEPEQAAFEAALDRATSSTDPEAACAAWAEVQEVMWTSGTVMNLSDVAAYFGVRSNVEGFVSDALVDFRRVSVR